IYGFRGGDISTYFAAEEKICRVTRNTHGSSRVFVLKENYRSHPKLVDFFNHVFENIFRNKDRKTIPAVTELKPGLDNTKKGMGKIHDRLKENIHCNVFAEISGLARDCLSPGDAVTYDKLDTGEKKNPAVFIPAAGGKRVTVCNVTPARQKQTVAEVRKRLRNYYSDRIHFLLHNQPELRPNEIAVLCDTNDSCCRMQEELSRYGIKSVLAQQGSIWHTTEADELQLFLDGVYNYRSDNKLKGALTSAVIGIDEADVADIMNDQRREQWTVQFEEWNRLLAAGRIQAVILAALHKEYFVAPGKPAGNFFQRQLGLYNGERTAANVLHMAELLGEIQRRGNLDSMALLRQLTALRR
ncbi:MAG TPA: hypothetical protein VKS21_04110, partial [Spirochaetota bacterium]|nr:hypothetical protein [Spirochaetota bacterium]